MKRRIVIIAWLALSVLAAAASASAQLLAAKDGPIVYGHHHLTATNIEEHKKFFVDALGGTALKIGTANNVEIVKFPNVLIFFRAQAPTGGSKGSTADHIGFTVPNLRAAVDKVKANGFKMITSSEITPDREAKDDISAPPQPGGATIAYALGPDGVKVELLEAKQQTVPIQLNHIHLFGQQNVAMREWYVKTFGAKPRAANPGSVFLSADLPGVAFNFTPVTSPVAGTQGRAVDHIGFEVKNLEAFTKKLEADGIKLDRPYTKVPALDIAVAFFTDPWGTYIELTEGLDRVK